MKELEIICKTCIHTKVCAYLPNTVNTIENINTDIKSGNYQGNIVIKILCSNYVEEDRRRK